MRWLASLLIGSMLFILPPATAQAQYEGTDARYREERRADRAKWRWIQMGAGAVVLVVIGGAWAVKKYRGEA